jgi:hypothetical protein
MHDSHGTDVYLSCSSRPIIENSTGIVFAEYPRTVAEKAGIDKQQEEWVVKGLVEDFNWLRKEHSPNWSISEKLREDTWQKVLENTKIPSVDTILDLVIER